MGRMFRIIVEGGSETPPPVAAPIEKPATSESNESAQEPVPFVEVGGPEGIVSSAGEKTERLLLPQPETVPTAEQRQPDPKDELVPLSVEFHHLPNSALRLIEPGIDPELVTFHFPHHPVVQEYRLVRYEIAQQVSKVEAKILGFASARPAAGTTTVLLNLAALLAGESAGKVLVVDACSQRSAIAGKLNSAVEPGWQEVLRQTTPLAWALQPTPIANLHLLASGSPLTGEAGTDAPVAGQILSQLRQWFQWILIDLGVWSETNLAPAVAHGTDAVYLISRQTELEAAEFISTRQSIVSARGPLKGLIATRK